MSPRRRAPRPVGTPPEWTPERVIDAGEAAAVIAEQFPELAGLPVRPFAAGWDNVLFSVGEEYLFRFVHRSVALPGARRELAVLTHLADALPLAVPHPRYVGRPTERIDWPFWGARRIPGVELAEAALPGDARAEVARQLGEFLRLLHSPSLGRTAAAAAEAAGAPLVVDPLRRGDPVHTAGRARARLLRLVAAGVELPCSAIEDLATTAERVGPPSTRPVLVHGDLHVRHVLVSDGRATGVVDWGDTTLADAAVDLMLPYAAFDDDARAGFLDAYGPVDGGAELRARVLAVHVSAALLEYGLDVTLPALVDEASAAIARAVS